MPAGDVQASDFTGMESVNNKQNEFVRQVAEQKYEFGFTTDVHTDIIDKGLTEDTVRLISAKKGEPEWMLDFGEEEGRGQEGD